MQYASLRIRYPIRYIRIKPFWKLDPAPDPGFINPDPIWIQIRRAFNQGFYDKI